MARKTIIPDFTLALGADLREAAAKMREMSRPPVHAPAPPAEDPARTPPASEAPSPAVPPRIPSENTPSVPPQAAEASGGLAASAAPQPETETVTNQSQKENEAGTSSDHLSQALDVQDFSEGQARSGTGEASEPENALSPSAAAPSPSQASQTEQVQTSSEHFVSERQQKPVPLSAAVREEGNASAPEPKPHEGPAAVVAPSRTDAPSAPSVSSEDSEVFHTPAARDTAASPVPSGGEGTSSLTSRDSTASRRPLPDREMPPTAPSGNADAFPFPAPEPQEPASREESPSLRSDAPVAPVAASCEADGLDFPAGRPCGPVTAPSAQEGVLTQTDSLSVQAPLHPETAAYPSEAAEHPAPFAAQAGTLPESLYSHKQSSTVTDRHQQPLTAHDSTCSPSDNEHRERAQGVTSSHQQSQAVINSNSTITDRHSQSSPLSPSSVQGKPAQERLTDVSPSPLPEEGRTVLPRPDAFTPPSPSAAAFPEEPMPYAPAKAPMPSGTGFSRARAGSPAPRQEQERRIAARTEGASSPHRQSPTVTMTVTDTSNTLLQQAYPSRHSAGEAAIASATLSEAPLGGARQTLLDTLERLRGQSPQVVVNLKRLAAAIGLSYGTVRNTISRLVREGVICTTQVRTGEAHGVCIEFLDDAPLQSVTVMGHQAIMPSPMQGVPHPVIPNSHQQSMTPYDVSYSAGPMTPAMTDDDTPVWSADAELIADLWPAAAEAGFGPAHLAHLRRAYRMQGWNADNVSRCLRYLDWELDAGLGKGPEHVEQWMRIMRRQGHYPRPEGYMEPEVLRLHQQAQEQRELAQARQELADAQALLNPAGRQR